MSDREKQFKNIPNRCYDIGTLVLKIEPRK